jgi:hypothetical protein
MLYSCRLGGLVGRFRAVATVKRGFVLGVAIPGDSYQEICRLEEVKIPES